jgi:hypothetical protein
MTTRSFTTKRNSIAKSIAELLKQIDGTGSYNTNLYENVHPKLLFWDEISEYPAVHLTPGEELREYQGGGYKDRYLYVTVRCYVQDDDAAEVLEGLLEDIETVIEENGRLAYQDSLGTTNFTHDIRIERINTDEGALNPIGVGEILLQVHY